MIKKKVRRLVGEGKECKGKRRPQWPRKLAEKRAMEGMADLERWGREGSVVAVF